MKHWKERLLGIAEVVDAWRVVPRFLVTMYGMMIYITYQWYQSIPTYTKIECDDRVLSVLLQNSIDLSVAEPIACGVVDVVGGPTTGQSLAISALMGLATALFAFYTSSGRKWNQPQGYNKPNVMTPPPIVTPSKRHDDSDIDFR